MRLSIIVADNAVRIDGVLHTVDCSSLTGIATVDWDDNYGGGSVQYVTVDGVVRAAHQITSIAPFKNLISAWNAANAEPPPPSSEQPVIVTEITRRQLILILLQLGYITSAEAIAAATTGAAPAIIAAYLAALPDAQRTIATVTWASMSVCLRSDPMLAALASANGLTDAQLDGFFATAATL